MKFRAFLVALSALPLMLAFQNCGKAQGPQNGTGDTLSMAAGSTNQNTQSEEGTVTNIKVATYDVASVTIVDSNDNGDFEYSLVDENGQLRYSVSKDGQQAADGVLSAQESQALIGLLAPLRMIPRNQNCAQIDLPGYASIKVKDGSEVVIGQRVRNCDVYLDLPDKNKQQLFSLLQSL